MILWSTAAPYTDDFARAVRVGSWMCDPDGHEVRCSPLVIEWENKSKRVGDLIATGFDADLLARRSCAQILLDEGVIGFRAGDVFIQHEPGKREPMKEFCEIVPTIWVECDLDRSSVILSGGEYRVHGVERYESHWDKTTKSLVRRKVPRAAGQGIIAAESKVPERGFFRVQQFPAFMCCTDETKTVIERSCDAGVEFLEVGETAG